MKIIWDEFTDTWIFGILCGIIIIAFLCYALPIAEKAIYNLKQLSGK